MSYNAPGSSILYKGGKAGLSASLVVVGWLGPARVVATKSGSFGREGGILNRLLSLRLCALSLVIVTQ